MRVLVVEDETKLAAHLCEALRDAGYVVDSAGGFNDAHMLISGIPYEAVILDLGLPDGDGLALVRQLRARGSATAILALTARDGVENRVAGLDVGCDDYAVKPFAMAELLARLRALLRRPGAVLGQRLALENVVFDTLSRAVEVDGRPVALGRRELVILEAMMRRAERVVTKGVLHESAYALEDEPRSNAVEVHVHHLRRRLHDAGARANIVTLRGLGYMMTADQGASA